MPPWPGPLNWSPPSPLDLSKHRLIDERVRHVLVLPDSIRGEVWANDHRRQTEGCEALDEHVDLIRSKVTGIFAVWDGRLDVNDEDWWLAGEVVACSVRTRRRVEATIAAVGKREHDVKMALHEDREARGDAAVERRRVVDAARWIGRKVQDEPDRWTRRGLFIVCKSTKRPYFDDGLDHAKAEGWVVEVGEASSTGDDARLLRPGDRKVPR